MMMAYGIVKLDYDGVWHYVIFAAPRRERKLNSRIRLLQTQELPKYEVNETQTKLEWSKRCYYKVINTQCRFLKTSRAYGTCC